MIKYIKMAHMSYLKKTNGGVIYLLPDIILKICTLIPLVYLWRVVMSSGVDVGMTMSQMITYTYVSALLSDMMVVQTAATGWLSEGVLMRLYGRPLSVIGQLIFQTIGGWLPMLVLFSLPMAIISPLFEVSLKPASLWFFLSLLLCISLGFAIDLLFSCLSIKLRNMSWLISRLLIVAINRLQLKITFVWIIMLILYTLCTMVTIVARSYLVSTTAFYAPVAAEEISMTAIEGTWQLSTFPLSGMPGFIQIPLLTILPEGLMAWYPALCLLGRPPLNLTKLYPLFYALVLTITTCFIFRKGLKYYVQKGSNRYLPYGFRR